MKKFLLCLIAAFLFNTAFLFSASKNPVLKNNFFDNRILVHLRLQPSLPLFVYFLDQKLNFLSPNLYSISKANLSYNKRLVSGAMTKSKLRSIYNSGGLHLNFYINYNGKDEHLVSLKAKQIPIFNALIAKLDTRVMPFSAGPVYSNINSAILSKTDSKSKIYFGINSYFMKKNNFGIYSLKGAVLNAKYISSKNKSYAYFLTFLSPKQNKDTNLYISIPEVTTDHPFSESKKIINNTGRWNDFLWNINGFAKIWALYSAEKL